MYVTLRNRRFTLPVHLRITEPLLVEITHKGRSKDFVYVLPKGEARITVPVNLTIELDIQNKESINVNVRKIRLAKQKSTNLIKGELIDFLSMVPKKTSKGYQLIVFEFNTSSKKYLRIWYSSRSRSKELILRRFVPSKCVKLFGYYQAEGNKISSLRSRSGLDAGFTNTSIKLLSEFLNLAKLFYPSGVWKVSCTYNRSFSQKKVKQLVKKFTKLTGIRKVSLYKSDRIKVAAFKIYESNTILSEILNYGVTSLRKTLAKDDPHLFLSKKYFLQGIFAGDGSINVYSDKSLHVRIHLYEQHEKVARDYLKILETLNISGTYRKEKGKNLFVITINGNWRVLYLFYELGIFREIPHNFNKLIYAIKTHDKTRVFSYLIYCKKPISTESLRKELSWPYERLRKWLSLRQKEGYITNLGYQKRAGRVWKLTKEGVTIVNLLKHVKSEKPLRDLRT